MKIDQNEDIIALNKNIYDQVFSKIYDDYHINTTPKHYSQNLFISIIKQMSKDPNTPLRILDIGCGTGTYAKLFLKHLPNSTLVANDISSKMLDIFTSRLADEEKRRVDISCEDASQLLNNSKGYDVICTESTLHHLPSYLEIIEGISKAIKPNGKLLIFDEPLSNPRFIGRILRTIESLVISASFKDVKGGAKLVRTPFRLLGSIYATKYPERARVLRNKANGYPLSNEQREAYVKSEHHDGLDIASFKDILNSTGFTIELEQVGPSYDFYPTYALSRVLGSTHFLLVAKKEVKCNES